MRPKTSTLAFILTALLFTAAAEVSYRMEWCSAAAGALFVPMAIGMMSLSRFKADDEDEFTVPDFTNEEIFDTMERDLIAETNNINDVLNYRMKNYDSTYILFNAFTRSQNDTRETNITAIICEDDKLCNMVISNKEFNMIADGIDVAINAIVQETQNIYNDYKKIKDERAVDKGDGKKVLDITRENVTSWYINNKFKQVDVNLNFVLSLVQQRIYTAFLEDSNNLTHKFQNMINIFNSCAIIYCCLLGIFVIIFVVYKIKSMTKIVEDSTMRLNKAFCFIKENNLGNQMNSQTNSII
jgi:hypothetical protein